MNRFSLPSGILVLLSAALCAARARHSNSPESSCSPTPPRSDVRTSSPFTSRPASVRHQGRRLIAPTARASPGNSRANIGPDAHRGDGIRFHFHDSTYRRDGSLRFVNYGPVQRGTHSFGVSPVGGLYMHRGQSQRPTYSPPPVPGPYVPSSYNPSPVPSYFVPPQPTYSSLPVTFDR